MVFFKRESADAVTERIRAAIAELRPLLRMDTVGIELVSFDPAEGVAVLRFDGDCPDCELSVGMLRQGIEAHLRREVPEIRAIRAVES